MALKLVLFEILSKFGFCVAVCRVEQLKYGALTWCKGSAGYFDMDMLCQANAQRVQAKVNFDPLPRAGTMSQNLDVLRPSLRQRCYYIDTLYIYTFYMALMTDVFSSCNLSKGHAAQNSALQSERKASILGPLLLIKHCQTLSPELLRILKNHMFTSSTAIFRLGLHRQRPFETRVWHKTLGWEPGLFAQFYAHFSGFGVPGSWGWPFRFLPSAYLFKKKEKHGRHRAHRTIWIFAVLVRQLWSKSSIRELWQCLGSSWSAGCLPGTPSLGCAAFCMAPSDVFEQAKILFEFRTFRKIAWLAIFINSVRVKSTGVSALAKRPTSRAKLERISTSAAWNFYSPDSWKLWGVLTSQWLISEIAVCGRYTTAASSPKLVSLSAALGCP